jgi:hypothetical protein
MSGGVISGNSAAASGGGVHLFAGMFTMSGGVISGNSAAASGGGVGVSASGRFAKTGGVIYGYDGAAPNDPYNDKVVNSSGIIQNNSGHAVSILNTSYRGETTLGPENQLFYNYPGTGGISDW